MVAVSRMGADLRGYWQAQSCRFLTIYCDWKYPGSLRLPCKTAAERARLRFGSEQER